MNRMKNVNKLRQLYQSIETPNKKVESSNFGNQRNPYSTMKSSQIKALTMNRHSALDQSADRIRYPTQMSGERSAYESNLRDQILSLSNKRNSYNGKQQDFINRLTENILHKHADSDQKKTQLIPRFTEESELHNIMSNKQNLAKFREMVVMHIKKNDLSTKILGSDFEKVSNDVILPLTSFKQCLRVVGITLKPEVSNHSSLITLSATAVIRSQGRH